MTAAQIAGAIKDLHPRFLEGLAPAEVKQVLAAARLRRLAANYVVTHQGDPPTQLFLLLQGRARYFFMTPDGRKVLLFWIPPGEGFGGAAFLSKPQPYLVSSETVRSSTVLVWERAAIRQLAQQYPRLVENALLIAFDYLVAYRAIHASLVCHSARQRLAQVLTNLADGIGQHGPDGIELDVHNEELANEANVTPFTASRLLSEWQRKGFLVKSRGKLLVRCPEELSLHQL